jgi:hypothetical protein
LKWTTHVLASKTNFRVKGTSTPPNKSKMQSRLALA